MLQGIIIRLEYSCFTQSLYSISRIELPVTVLHMDFHSLIADTEPTGDFLLKQSARHKKQNLPLTGREGRFLDETGVVNS